MAQAQFSLSWESYKTNICSGFSSFQQNGELVDMTLAADGHLVKVHQVLIALASPYLKELITSVPTQHPVIFLNNVSHVTLSLILEYIYTGEVRVPAENLSSFIEAAKALHVRGLENITDGGQITKMDISVNESNQEPSRISRKSDQIILPPNAKKIFVDINPDSSAVVSAKKPLVGSYADDNMHDYSDRIDDTDHDFDYDDDEDGTQNKGHTPVITLDHNNQITSRKVSAENSKLNSNLQFTVSIRGALQVILNRYIYNLHSSQSSGVRRWRCIDYRNKKCSAFVITNGNVVLNRANPHNHTFHDQKILGKIEKNAVYSALDDVQDLAIVKEKNKSMPEDNDFASL